MLETEEDSYLREAHLKILQNQPNHARVAIGSSVEIPGQTIIEHVSIGDRSFLNDDDCFIRFEEHARTTKCGLTKLYALKRVNTKSLRLDVRFIDVRNARSTV